MEWISDSCGLLGLDYALVPQDGAPTNSPPPLCSAQTMPDSSCYNNLHAWAISCSSGLGHWDLRALSCFIPVRSRDAPGRPSLGSDTIPALIVSLGVPSHCHPRGHACLCCVSAHSLCWGRGFAPELGLHEDVMHLLPCNEAEDCLSWRSRAGKSILWASAPCPQHVDSSACPIMNVTPS